MNTFSICITTFKERLPFVRTLVSQIRGSVQNNILICVNGEKDGKFDDGYRKSILSLCCEFSNVFPIFFIEMRGLAKMWNTLLSHSDSHFVLMLNDDLQITSFDIFNKTNLVINHNEFSGIALINNSFSHYVVDRRIIDKIGYFDERLLGFGEEDGDVTYRLETNGIQKQNFNVNGVDNIVSSVRNEVVKNSSFCGSENKYSLFNRSFIYGQKYDKELNGAVKGMFDFPMKTVLNNEKVFPYESFFWDHKQEVFKV